MTTIISSIVTLGPLLILIGACIVVYFSPTMMAFNRMHPRRWLILTLNLVVGCTVIGWIWMPGLVAPGWTRDFGSR